MELKMAVVNFLVPVGLVIFLVTFYFLGEPCELLEPENYTDVIETKCLHNSTSVPVVLSIAIIIHSIPIIVMCCEYPEISAYLGLLLTILSAFFIFVANLKGTNFEYVLPYVVKCLVKTGNNTEVEDECRFKHRKAMINSYSILFLVYIVAYCAYLKIIVGFCESPVHQAIFSKLHRPRFRKIFKNKESPSNSE